MWQLPWEHTTLQNHSKEGEQIAIPEWFLVCGTETQQGIFGSIGTDEQQTLGLKRCIFSRCGSAIAVILLANTGY